MSAPRAPEHSSDAFSFSVGDRPSTCMSALQIYKSSVFHLYPPLLLLYKSDFATILQLVLGLAGLKYFEDVARHIFVKNEWCQLIVEHLKLHPSGFELLRTVAGGRRR